MTTSLRQRSLCTSRSSYSPTGSRVMVPRTAFCTSRTRLSDANAHASNFSHLKHNPQAAANQHGQVKSQTIISNLQGDGAPALIQNADWIKQCGANLEIRPAFLQQQQGANGSTRLQNQPQLEPISMDDWKNRSPITSEEDSLKSLPGDLTLFLSLLLCCVIICHDHTQKT